MSLGKDFLTEQFICLTLGLKHSWMFIFDNFKCFHPRVIAVSDSKLWAVAVLGHMCRGQDRESKCKAICGGL